MNTKDELVQIISSPESFDGGPASCGPNPIYAARTADAFLAAGWVKPRTITTVDELDALPVGSVVLDRDGDAWQRYQSGWTCTDRALNTSDQPSSSLAWVLAPATVLHEGQA